MERLYSGRCQCGHVTYEIYERFLIQVVCHCTECQKLSATAYSISAFLKRDKFRLVSGNLSSFSRLADSGRTNTCYFCAGCGNRIYHETPEEPELIRLKPGTLDDTSIIRPTIHIWVRSKQSWVTIPENMECYETQPVASPAACIISSENTTHTGKAQVV